MIARPKHIAQRYDVRSKSCQVKYYDKEYCSSKKLFDKIGITLDHRYHVVKSAMT